jgi:hypothetical protein
MGKIGARQFVFIASLLAVQFFCCVARHFIMMEN